MKIYKNYLLLILVVVVVAFFEVLLELTWCFFV